MKQEALAFELGVSQQAVSKLEQSETIEEEKLKLIAEKLGVSVEGIKQFDEEKAINVIQNNFEGSNNNGTNLNYQCAFNPLDKMVELYERLLKTEREKNALLEKMLKH